MGANNGGKEGKVSEWGKMGIIGGRYNENTSQLDKNTMKIQVN